MKTSYGLRRIFLPILSMMLLLTLQPAAQADMAASQIEVAGNNLSLNGNGARKKAFISVYDAALYLLQPSADAPAIVSADEPMVIELKILSGLLSAKKIIKALNQGFEKSTGGKTEPIAADIKQLATAFDQGVAKGDRFRFAYVPQQGLVVSKGATEVLTLGDLAFKQAFFGIWLSDNPVQDSLKTKLLGQ